MEFKELHKDRNTKNLTSIVLLTVIFGIASVFFGYLALPLAGASYAALLFYENKNRRVLSYVLPVAIAFLDFSINWVNGYFSEQSLAYVAAGVVIYLCYSKKTEKNLCTVLLTVTLSAFLFIGILFLGFNQADSASISALIDVVKGTYYQAKDTFISALTSITSSDDFGVIYIPITREYAEQLFHIILQILPAAVITFALLLSAIALKFFDIFTRKEKYQEKNPNWIFNPSKVTGIFYIIVAVLNALIFGTDIFTVTVYNIYIILLSVFAYLGFKFIYCIVTMKRSAFFAITLILASVLIFGTTAFAIVSYLGVYYTFISHKIKNNSDLQDHI